MCPPKNNETGRRREKKRRGKYGIQYYRECGGSWDVVNALQMEYVEGANQWPSYRHMSRSVAPAILSRKYWWKDRPGSYRVL